MCVCVCRLGVRSLVLESSEELRTTGFALTIWTNAWRALDAVGIGDAVRAKSLQIQKYCCIFVPRIFSCMSVCVCVFVLILLNLVLVLKSDAWIRVRGAGSRVARQISSCKLVFLIKIKCLFSCMFFPCFDSAEDG